MNGRCADQACPVDRPGRGQRGTLRLALGLNAAMFVVEFAAGLAAGSMALLADSLDMLGDALVYGMSLHVLDRGPVWSARAALAKALVMGGFGGFVVARLIERALAPELPAVPTMGLVAALALGVNALCFALLWRHRAEDLNLCSVWLCSRNDLIANVAVLVAAAGVALSGSPWPDLAAGALLSVLFLRSAFTIARQARTELRRASSAHGAWARMPE